LFEGRKSAIAGQRFAVRKLRPIKNGAALFPMTMADPLAARGIDEQPTEGERLRASGDII
jgi:hypothetical protein